jgi:hypothetical protein
MKTKKVKNKPHHPLHLHLEYFFRKQYCLLFMLGLLGIAAIKADTKMVGMVRQAYVHGFGVVGEYMREETTRSPVSFSIGSRTPTYSGK